MELAKSYIVDQEGDIQSVVLRYQDYKKIETILLDLGLGKAMEEIEDDEEINLDEAKKLTGFNDANSI